MRSKCARMLALVTVLALVASLLTAAPALAAKGGPHHTTTATLSLWQNGVPVTSAASGSTVDVKCAGLPANTMVYVGLMNTVGLTSVVTDGSGACAVPWRLEYPGSYNFQVGTLSNKGYRILAMAPLTVS